MTKPLFLGIEIGGTKLQLGLGRGDGRLIALDRRLVDPTLGAEGILGEIHDRFGPLARSIGREPETVSAVGIGFGGPVDAERGVVMTSHQVSGWDGFALTDWVRRALGIGVVALQNDADTAGLAEARFGAGVGHSPVLYVTIGSGIGGGLIIGGQIYRGAGSGAVEIGHLWVTPRNVPDRSPQRLEDVASGWAITRRARSIAEQAVAQGRQDETLLRLANGKPESVTTRAVAEAACEGDPLALELLDAAVDAMAQGLAHAVTLLAPKRIILGGGVSLIGEGLWLAPIRRRLNQLIFPPFREGLEVVAATLGEEVVVHGALALAQDATDRAT
jgi:glucokinase